MITAIEFTEGRQTSYSEAGSMANKRSGMIPTPLMAAIVVTGAGCAVTPSIRSSREAPQAPTSEAGLRNFLMRMARLLRLSGSQKLGIEGILDAELELSGPLLKRGTLIRTRLLQVTQEDRFDEAAVRGMARELADIDAELTVISVRAQNSIHTLLTPEQRELVLFLRSETAPRPRYATSPAVRPT